MPDSSSRPAGGVEDRELVAIRDVLDSYADVRYPHIVLEAIARDIVEALARSAGDRGLTVERLAELIQTGADSPREAFEIAQQWVEITSGSAGDADHLTARECKLVVSGFEKTRNMEELTNAEDMALVRLDRLAGGG